MPSVYRFRCFLFTLSFSISFTAPAARAAVTVSPARAAVVITTETQQFKASVSGVTWSVDNIVGGNSTVGTISTSGLYTPPATAGAHNAVAILIPR
jgi:hypothetical protein